MCLGWVWDKESLDLNRRKGSTTTPVTFFCPYPCLTFPSVRRDEELLYSLPLTLLKMMGSSGPGAFAASPDALVLHPRISTVCLQAAVPQLHTLLQRVQL